MEIGEAPIGGFLGFGDFTHSRGPDFYRPKKGPPGRNFFPSPPPPPERGGVPGLSREWRGAPASSPPLRFPQDPSPRGSDPVWRPPPPFSTKRAPFNTPPAGAEPASGVPWIWKIPPRDQRKVWGAPFPPGGPGPHRLGPKGPPEGPSERPPRGGLLPARGPGFWAPGLRMTGGPQGSPKPKKTEETKGE